MREAPSGDILEESAQDQPQATEESAPTRTEGPWPEGTDLEETCPHCGTKSYLNAEVLCKSCKGKTRGPAVGCPDCGRKLTLIGFCEGCEKKREELPGRTAWGSDLPGRWGVLRATKSAEGQE